MATDAEKTLWQDYASHKNLTIYIYGKDKSLKHTLTNTDIKSEGMTLTQTLEANDCLTFQGCNASVFEIEITDLADDVRGCRLAAFIKVGDYTQELFDGVIEEQENQTHEDILTTLTAYDWMRTINQIDCTSWAKTIGTDSFKITGMTPFGLMQRFFKDVISVKCPLVVMDSSYYGDWLSNPFTSEADFSNYDSVTGESIMKWLCQVGNIYGFMVGNILAFRRLEEFSEAVYPGADLYPSTDLFPSSGGGAEKILKSNYMSLDYEPYKVEKINSVAVCDSEGDIAEGIYPEGDVGSNCYYIDSNPFAWAMNMQSLAAVVYNRVKNLTYTPIDIECVGMPYLSLGDVVRASTKKRTVYSYILKRTMKGIQALTDEYESDSDQYQSEHAENYSSITSENGKKILRIQADEVQMNALIAQRATITELNSTKANLENVIAQKATISDLNAAKGRIDTIESNYITADNINAKTFTLTSGHIGNLDASKITSGTISASRIDVDTLATSSFSGKGINCYSLTASYGATIPGIVCSQSLRYQGTSVSWITQTIAGVKIKYLGTSTS